MRYADLFRLSVSQEGWLKTLEEKLTFHGMSESEWVCCKLGLRILKWTTRHIKGHVEVSGGKLTITETGIRRLQGELDDKEQYDRLFSEFCAYRDSTFNQKMIRVYKARECFESIALNAIRNEKVIALGLRNTVGVIQGRVIKSGTRPLTPEEKKIVDQFNRSYQPMVTEACAMLKALMPDLF